MDNPNTRWASPQMLGHWTDRHTALLYRSGWLVTLQAQTETGILNPPDGALKAYNTAYGTVDLDRIRTLEQQTGHHLQAHLMHYEETAGTDRHGHPWGLLHRGLTSCDITDLATQTQIETSLDTISDHYIALLHRIGNIIEIELDTRTCGRTHGLPAQPTTIGRRFATWADQMLYAASRIADQPMRVLGGAIGNRNDLYRLAGQDHDTVDHLVALVGERDPQHPQLVTAAPNQTYHRILDLELASWLTMLTAPLTNMAATLRAMATLGHITETPTDSQTGSSAMPHKTNPRYLERITSLHRLLRGHLTTLANTSADQLFEGDVADSAARRIAIPGAFTAADGIICSAITALDRLRFDRTVIGNDYRHHLPHMLSGQLLQIATNRPTYPGQTRLDMHNRLRHHAHTTETPQQFRDAVIADQGLSITRYDFDQVADNNPTGQATDQAQTVLQRIRDNTRPFTPEELNWTPDGTL